MGPMGPTGSLWAPCGAAGQPLRAAYTGPPAARGSDFGCGKYGGNGGKGAGSDFRARLRAARPPARPGVRAGPGTPRDPKSHLFVTNRVAIRPFFAFEAGKCAEFQRGSRQGGPTPSISFFLTIFGMFLGKGRFLAGKKRPCEATPPRSNRAWKSQPLQGP